MGTKTQTFQFDDLDGQSPADETVEFRGPDGKLRVIDLTADHATQLREAVEEFEAAMADFVKAGRLVEPKVAGPRKGRGAAAGKRPAARPDRAQNEAVREWAQRNGYSVAARGRISAEIQQAFQENRPAVPTLVEVTPAPTGRRKGRVSG